MENFKMELINKIQTALGDKGNVFFENRTIKDVSMEFLSVQLTQENRCCATPLAQLYQLKQAGLSISEIANAVTTSLVMERNIDKNQIIFRLVNASENEELLKTVPHIPFYDMAIIFQCTIFSEGSRGFHIISQIQMEQNHLTLQQLSDLALKNTFRLFPCQASPLAFCMLEELMASKNATLKDFQEFALHAFYSKEMPILQTTCKGYPSGSAAMLNLSFLSKIADDMRHDLLLLPASEQNFAIVPYTKETDKNAVHQMVDEALAVDDSPILTRYVFLFNRATKRLGVFI